MQMYLRLESALSRLAQSGWRWSREDLGPMYETRHDLAEIMEPDQAAALSALIMNRLDDWEDSRKTH
jgi:hypothetical protein